MPWDRRSSALFLAYVSHDTVARMPRPCAWLTTAWASNRPDCEGQVHLRFRSALNTASVTWTVREKEGSSPAMGEGDFFFAAAIQASDAAVFP